MVKSCSAINCTKRYVKGDNVAFFKFPNDPNALKKWLVRMRRDKWMPNTHSVICSLHFTPDAFEQSGWASKRILKPDAVPSVFDFPEHLQKEVKTRKPPLDRNPSVSDTTDVDCIVEEVPSPRTSDVQQPPIKNKRQYYPGDFKDEIPGLQKAQLALKNKAKKIKQLQRDKKRLREKVNSLKKMVAHLKSKNFTSDHASHALLVSDVNMYFFL
uniref:THAP domain-containing protein 2 n=1 Tax=Cacopsylla melanoneura TaxID=428564 RepID=A0A8D8T224_9HEMI